MEEKSSLEELKKDYIKLQSKYKLPSFQELNENFEIEKAAQNETDYLLREIRKNMMDKAIAYLRFIEMLMNPSNAPMFFFALVKGLTSSDKGILEKIYNKIGNFEINVIELDCKYDEKAEAEFIKNLSNNWEEITQDMLKLTSTLKTNWSQKSGKNNRDYCG